MSLFLHRTDNNFTDTRFYFRIKEGIIEIMGSPRSRIM